MAGFGRGNGYRRTTYDLDFPCKLILITYPFQVSTKTTPPAFVIRHLLHQMIDSQIY